MPEAAYYLYHLIDPRDGRTFYVGKGKGNRVHHHEMEAAKGRVSRKCDTIREIVASGHAVAKRIVARFEDEALAYFAEKIEIAAIGLQNLTNVVPGGSRYPQPTKPYPFKWQPAHLAKLAPQIVRALVMIVKTGGLFLYGQEVTASVIEMMGQMIRDIGPKQFQTAMNEHGLKIKLAD